MADDPGDFWGPRSHPVRRLVWTLTGCGVLAVAGLAAGPARVKLDANPVPSSGQVQAAQNKVNQQAAALGRQEEKLAQANAQLTSLETRAEVLTESYDKTIVAEQQAQTAYTTAVKRLTAAQQAESSSRRDVAGLAANEYETQGGFDPMAAMLGDAHGVQAYLNQVGLGQVFTNRRTDILARNSANSVVDKVFRTQASTALRDRKADVKRAAALKAQVEAAVSQQQSAVQSAQSTENQISGALGSAKNHEHHLATVRNKALAAAAAAEAAKEEREREQAEQQSPSPSTSVGSSAYAGSSASSSQGDIAANFALSQIGRPYQWAAAGPSTYDCSGLTMVAWAHAGVTLLHYTGYQWEEGTHVSLNDLQRGDLLFYATNNSDPATIHHVGIYIGSGNMVDAPYTGVDVRIDSIYQPGVPIGAVRP